MSMYGFSLDAAEDIARRCAERTVAYAEARRATRRNRQYRTLEVRAWARVWWLVCDVWPMPAPPSMLPVQEVHHVPERHLRAALEACGMTAGEARKYAREPKTVTDMLCPAARKRKHTASAEWWERVKGDPARLEKHRENKRKWANGQRYGHIRAVNADMLLMGAAL